MPQRKMYVYCYNSDTQQFMKNPLECLLERQVTNIESKNEEERVYAINPHNKIRWSVADRPGKVYHDRNAHMYKVWFDSPDREKAIDAIGNYILDHIAPVIRDSESFLKNLEQKKLAAIKLLEELQ